MSPVAKSFKAAVAAVPALNGAYRPGLQALREADRHMISCPETKNLAGSLNLDNALEREQPHASRWDYGIGHKTGVRDVVLWVEVHPASSNHIGEMINKIKWLKGWLNNRSATALRALTRTDGYVWLSPSSVTIQKGSTQARQLAAAGLSFPQRRLELR